jgi:drug/metabolite transporter (DMT)-like permease
MNLFLLLILGTIWGTSFLFIKIIVSEVPPMTLVAGRLGVAALLMWVILRLRQTPRRRDDKLWRTFAVVGLLNGALPYYLISWGEQYIPSGWAALLQATTPLFTILLAHVITDDDRITGPKIAGVILGFAGVGILMWPELQSGIGAPVLGMLAIVGASLSYAFASIYARSRLSDQSPMVAAAGQFTMGFAYILPLALAIESPWTLTPSVKAILSWAALAIFGTVIAYTIYYELLRRTNATFTTMVTYIVPINGLLLGALILDEPLSPSLLLSLGLVLGGVLLVRQ